MHITIELDGSEPHEKLHALAALINALGGRMPGTLGEPFVSHFPALPVIGTHEPLVNPEFVGGAPVPPPPPPPVSATPVPPPPPPVAGETDANGLPWDARIHSSSRERTGDGNWRKRRGVDDATVAQVTAELRGGPNVQVVPPPPPPAVTASPEPVATAAPNAPPPPPPPADESKVFPELIRRIGQCRGGVGYPYEELDAMAKGLGLTAFKDLLQQKHMIPYFEQLLEA